MALLFLKRLNDPTGAVELDSMHNHLAWQQSIPALFKFLSTGQENVLTAKWVPSKGSPGPRVNASLDVC
jgi:hypothetical protein